MKTSSDYSKTLVFDEDAPDGGCIVICPCGHVFNTKGLEECPECKAELLYPEKASW